MVSTHIDPHPFDPNENPTVTLMPGDSPDIAYLKGFKQAWVLSLWLYEDETILNRFIRLNPDYFKELGD